MIVGANRCGWLLEWSLEWLLGWSLGLIFGMIVGMIVRDDRWVWSLKWSLEWSLEWCFLRGQNSMPSVFPPWVKLEAQVTRQGCRTVGIFFFSVHDFSFDRCGLMNILTWTATAIDHYAQQVQKEHTSMMRIWVKHRLGHSDTLKLPGLVVCAGRRQHLPANHFRLLPQSCRISCE